MLFFSVGERKVKENLLKKYFERSLKMKRNNIIQRTAAVVLKINKQEFLNLKRHSKLMIMDMILIKMRTAMTTMKSSNIMHLRVFS